MNFGAPQWLWALLAVPALAFLFMGAERRSAARLRQFVSPRLLTQLGATVSRGRRAFRFALLLLSLALALVSLAQPRWGYTYEDVKRKGLDLLIAVDTSRSMLANDVPPNRLQRVKLAAQDLIRELRGDRIGLVAFAGRAFLQAPLTIDYDAAVESLNELDTNIIPEGGTNISEAITLAVRTFGKAATGNRALIIFTDGEELTGEAVKLAKTAADSGVRIFTVGVGTPEGSLIPLQGAGGGTAFVKDPNGQVVKSKLDEGRLREIAEATGGIYVGLTNGPAAMRQLYGEGLARMQAGDIDTRTARRPVERFQWPLGAALLALAASMLITERKKVRRVAVPRARPKAVALAASALVLVAPAIIFAASPGLDEYRSERFPEAYQKFEQTLQEHPNTHATDQIQFDAGAAAYKMKDYSKAMESFSQALLSPDVQLQSRSHYNLGNTLYQRGESQKKPDDKLKDWTNALQHYEQTLKVQPENKEAKENYEFVKNKIEELKKQQEQQPSPTPTPTPSPSPQKNDKDKQDKQDKKDQDSKDKDKQQQQQNQDQQQQDKSDSDQKQDSQQKSEQKPGQSPSPSPSPQPGQTPSPSPAGASPSPSAGEQASPSPSAGENGSSPSPSPDKNDSSASPTPSPGEGETQGNEGATPTPTAAASPQKKPTGDVKGAGDDKANDPKDEQELAEAEQQEGQMTEQQAERLLRAMRDEEQHVQLDEHKAARRVLKDW
ncbi:MAG: VWA domain-containing protein [Verrucomicrobiota bacterium]|nr:VWA domain-containing protein [Verrucomicrobiota bacterium]